jgi:uncharacterized protein (DUF169 family)
MKIELKNQFLKLWKKYFGDAELPITFYYTTGDGGAEWADKPKGRSCLICELARVRNGRSLVYNVEALACMGARRYLGYSEKMIGYMEESFLITETWTTVKKRLTD